MSAYHAQQQDHRQAPRKKGRLVGQKRPLKPKDVWNIRARLQIEARKRDLAMFNDRVPGGGVVEAGPPR
jgi:hypothetical protein